MKVRELIKLLEKQDQELQVVLYDGYYDEHEIVTKVDYRKDLEAGFMSLEDIQSVKGGAIQIS